MNKLKSIILATCVIAMIAIVINGCKKTGDLNQGIETEQQLMDRVKAQNKVEGFSVTAPINKKIEFGYLDKNGVVKSGSEIRAQLQANSSFSPYCSPGGGVEQNGYLVSITRTNFVCGYNAPNTSVILKFNYRISTTENLNPAGSTRLRVKGKNIVTNAFTFTTQSTPPNTPNIPIITQTGATVFNTGIVDDNAINYPDNVWWDVCYTLEIPNSIFSNTHNYIINPIIATDCPDYPIVTGLSSSNYSFDVNDIFAPVCQRNDKVTCGWGYASQNQPPYIAGVSAVNPCNPYGYELPGGHRVRIYEGSTLISQEYITTTGVKNLPYLQVGHTYRFDFNNIKYSNFNPANLTTGIQCETSIPTSVTVNYFP